MPIVGSSEARPADGLAVDFVVESDRAQLNESSGCGTDACGPTSAPSRPSTRPSPPSTRPRDARGRRSSAFACEDSFSSPPLRSGRRPRLEGSRPGTRPYGLHWFETRGFAALLAMRQETTWAAGIRHAKRGRTLL